MLGGLAESELLEAADAHLAVEQPRDVVLPGVAAAEVRGVDSAEAGVALGGGRHACAYESLACGHQEELGGKVRGVVQAEVRGPEVEVPHLAGGRVAQAVRVEAVDGADAAAVPDQPLPERTQIAPQAGDHAHSGYHCASAHASPASSVVC